MRRKQILIAGLLAAVGVLLSFAALAMARNESAAVASLTCQTIGMLCCIAAVIIASGGPARR